MTTKDQCLALKSKQQNLVVNDNLNGHFNDLNLNQNNQCFVGIIKSKNVENHNKATSNYDHYSDLQTKQNSTSFGKTKLSSSFANLNNTQKDYGKKEKSKETLNANSSTLSLHITAYENSIEATSGGGLIDGRKDGTNKKKEKISSIKSWKTVKELLNDSASIKNSFELPRQQPSQSNDPEVSQFKASQRLFNPNQSNQQGMFGSNTSSFGSTFGSATFGSNNGPDGTTIAFEPLRGTDTMIRNGDNKEIQTKNMCITSMEQYKMKSIEELRVADYAANRKGNTGGSTGSSLFGSTAAKPSGGLFGSTTSNTFGQQQQPATGGSLFGSTTSNTNTGGGLFGSPAAKPATTGSLFGSTTNNSSTGGGLFGSTAAKPSLFGSTTSNTFGQQQQPATGGSLFGSTTSNTNTGGGLFGSTAAKPATSGSLFGSTTNNTNTGGSLFGSTAAKPATGGLFGGGTTNTFGQQQQPATGGSLFGSTTNNTSTGGGLFGSAAKPATGGSLFGSTTTNTNTGGGLFGSTSAQPSGGLFGSGTTNTFGSTAQQPTQQLMAAPAAAPVQPIYLGGKEDENAIKRAILESQLSTLPYGDSPIFKNRSALPGISSSSVLSRNSESSNVQSQLRKLANQALSPNSSPGTNTSSNGNTSALNNLSNLSALSSPNNSFSYKPLVGLPSLGFDSGRNQSSLNLSLRSSPQKLAKSNSIMSDSKKQSQSLKSFDVSVLKTSKSNAARQAAASAEAAVSTPPTAEDLTPQQSRRRSVCFSDVTQVRNTTDSSSVEVTETNTISNNEPVTTAAAAPKKSILVTPETRRPRDIITSQPPITPLQFSSETVTSDSPGMNTSSQNLSVLMNEGYYVEPPVEELEQTFKDGKYFLRGGLTVGRNGYGSVFWPGDFELSSIDFENIISFRSKEVVVYPDDETKPPLGVDLNRPAEVSLERVWPFDKETKEFVKDPTALGKLQFRARLERACHRMDARFIDYQVTTGTWTFGVTHFSKYGLMDDEDDDPMYTPEQLQALQRQKDQMSKIQRLPLEKKHLPLREIQADYSFAASGLGGNGGFVDPMIKYEGKTFGVTMNEDLDEPMDFKRIRLDHDMTSELLESKIDVDEEEPIPISTRQKLEPRKRDETIVKVPKNKLLRLRYQNLRSRAENLYLKGIRPQWHPSESSTILTQAESNCFVTRKITAVPLLQTYFEKYLESEGRLDELPKILQSSVLNFSPPSILIELIDAHILDLKRDTNVAEEKADEEIHTLCEAVLLSPTTPNYGIQQRRRLGEWIRKKLAPSLENILSNVSDDDDNLATRVIFECLSHGNVKEATKQAIRFKYFNLALFISLYNCSPSKECKDAFASQYTETVRIFQNAHKDKYMMSIYQMFAGPSHLQECLHDTASVSCFYGLSWLQIFGIFIWYAAYPADSLANLY